MTTDPIAAFDTRARDLLADGLARLDALALAHIDGDDGVPRVVVADGHADPALPADDDALE